MEKIMNIAEKIGETSRLKIGGCYRGKGDREGEWYICTGKYEDSYSGRFCFVDEFVTDETIMDIPFDEVDKFVDASVCYTPKYSKRDGLYMVKDESTGEQIILLQLQKNI